MRKLLTLLFILISYNVFAQTTTYTRGDTIVLTNINKAATIKLEIATKDTLGFVHNLGHGKIDFRVPVISDIRGLSSALAAAGGNIPGNSITSLPALNDTPGAGLKASDWIIAEFYKSQPPILVMSGGSNRERLPAGSDVISVGWTATRPLSGADISSIIINGVSQSYTHPSAGGNVSGSQNVTINRNSNITINGSANTLEPKSGTSSVFFGFYDKGYAGYATNALVSGKPITSDILGFSITDNSGGSTINNQSTAQQGSDKYYCFITTTTRSHVSINGTPSDAAFNFNIAITFTNGVGGTFNGYAHVSKFPGGSTAAVIYLFN